jgi:hypothetical protein
MYTAGIAGTMQRADLLKDTDGKITQKEGEEIVGDRQ